MKVSAQEFRLQDARSHKLGLLVPALFVGCKVLVLRVAFYLLVAVIIVFNLFPFFCGLLGSFRPSNALFSTNLSPKLLNFDHYKAVFARPIFVQSLVVI